MRRLAGKTISSLSSLNALLIHWRNIQFSHQCQLSSACRDAIRGRQWYLNCFVNIFPWSSSMAHHVSSLLHLTDDQLVLFQSTCWRLSQLFLQRIQVCQHPHRFRHLQQQQDRLHLPRQPLRTDRLSWTDARTHLKIAVQIAMSQNDWINWVSYAYFILKWTIILVTLYK